VIPSDRLAAVVEAALQQCRLRTIDHVSLPREERLTIEYVRNRPWSAFSRYQGGAHSLIQINTDFRFTIDQALQVACHEGYPGHHTRNLLMSAGAAAGWPERWLQLAFSRSALVSEAAAVAAIEVAFSPAERARVERERLFPLANLPARDADLHVAVERLVGQLQIVQANIARRYLDGELEFERAVTELEEQALVPHAEALVKYLNEYRSYVTTYTAGAAAFGEALAACAGAHSTDAATWRCFRELMLKPSL
jgi:hypothetical protein